MKKHLMVFALATFATVACSKKAPVGGLPKPGDAPPAVTAPIAEPAPDLSKLPSSPANELLGSFRTDCSTGMLKTKDDNVHRIYESYRTFLNIDHNTITQEVIWFTGSNCNAANQATSTALASMRVWIYNQNSIGQVDGLPWQLTLIKYNDIDDADSATVTMKRNYDGEDDASEPMMYFSNSPDLVYHRY